jgi:hypothetical protein
LISSASTIFGVWKKSKRTVEFKSVCQCFVEFIRHLFIDLVKR